MTTAHCRHHELNDVVNPSKKLRSNEKCKKRWSPDAEEGRVCCGQRLADGTERVERSVVYDHDGRCIQRDFAAEDRSCSKSASSTRRMTSTSAGGPPGVNCLM